ncbi:MAG: HipA domain-containing protein [Candidatus Eisenbacteria sp.]|nr:HipA domain-containing protein [Candidatus Eisenbacteria bacterium]
MRRCPITYESLQAGESTYSLRGLRRLSRALSDLEDLPYDAEEQLREAAQRATKMSIQGVQPKLSAKLLVKEGRFAIVDRGGEYILKPPNPRFPCLPENEDLTMRLAAQVGIEVPVHGLVRSRDGSWTYFIRRFDRLSRGRKLAVEDFAQLAGRTRQTKYDASMEQVAALVERFATFPVVEKLELLRRTLFCFLTGGEDMHLKNFSLITRGPRVQFSPAYDLVNSTIVLQRARDELALPLHGRQRNLRRQDLLEYFGSERLGLSPGAIDEMLEKVAAAQPEWDCLITASFLPEVLKDSYRELLRERRERLAGLR